MDNALSNQQTSQQSTEAQAQSEQKKGLPKALAFLEVGIFEVFFVGIALILLFGTLNYFNILPISQIWPNQFGWLPHKESLKQNNTAIKQSNNITIVPSPVSLADQTKQTLINLLTTIISPSLLPKSSSEITITQDETNKEYFTASFSAKEGFARLEYQNAIDAKTFNSLDFFFENIQQASPSVELAKSTIDQVFSLKPKGEWRCKPILIRRTYCEKFWSEGETKKGIGFLIISPVSTSIRVRLIYSFCEHTKESSSYSWKSCRAEFLKTGV